MFFGHVWIPECHIALVCMCVIASTSTEISRIQEANLDKHIHMCID